MLTPQRLYDLVKIDNIYFQTTGGGICFGGGEPTMYANFIKAFTLLDTQYNVKDWVDAIVEIYKQLYFIDPSLLHAEANNPANVLLL